VIAALVVVGVVAGAPGSSSLAACRRLEQAFETDAMPAPCRGALDDVALPVADRVDAAALLAFALVTNDDVEGGTAAYVRLLALAPGWTLASSASPRQRDAFQRARARLDAEGAVGIAATIESAVTSGAPDDDAAAGARAARLIVDVTDPLRRVAQVAWRLPGGGAPFPLVRDAAGTRWSGVLPTDVDGSATVEARSADGSLLASTTFSLAAARPSVGGDDGGGVPWVAIGAGAGAVVVVGAAVGAAVWALTGPLAAPGLVTVRVQ
jgi:hypothetical protein